MNLQLNCLLKNAITTVSAIILGRAVDYPTIDNFYRNMGTYAGLEHKFTEDWSVSLFGGLNYNWFASEVAVWDFEAFPWVRVRQQKQETFSVTPFFNIEGNRKWEKAGLALGYKLDQSASGGGTILEYHHAYARFSYRSPKDSPAAWGEACITAPPAVRAPPMIIWCFTSPPSSTTRSPRNCPPFRATATAGGTIWPGDAPPTGTLSGSTLSFAYPLHYQK